MDILEKIADVTGLKYEDLTREEREIAKNWINTIAEREIGVDEIKSNIEAMKLAVEGELAFPDLPKNQDIYLKARLKNYILLESFLMGPEKARKALDLYIKKIKVK